MRLETLLWAGVTVYFAVIGVIYMFVSDDPVGVSVLLSATGLGGLVAGWSWNWGRRHGERVEDDAGADASDATGIVGVYPTESLRPVALAVGSTALLLGVPLGSWLSMVGVAIVASQVMLLVRDLDT
jgi:hypothetical protein